jgi:integrase
VPLPVIQKRLGHKSIQITVDVYGGLLSQTHEIADQAVERAFAGQQIVTGGSAAALVAGRVDK